MREHVMRGMRGIVVSILAVATAACTGGSGGTVGGVDDGFEPFPGRRESPGGGREVPPPGSDPAPNNDSPPRNGVDVPPGGGGGGGGGFQCKGEYACVFRANGQEEKSNLKLTLDDGICRVGKDTTLDANGTVTTKGQSAGTWKLQPDGSLAISLGAVSGTCTPK